MPTVFAIIMTPEVTEMLAKSGLITQEQREVLMKSGLRLAEKRIVGEIAEGTSRALHENFAPQDQAHAWLLVETMVDLFIKFGLMSDKERDVIFGKLQQTAEKAAKSAGFKGYTL